ncbi:MAG: type IV pilus secretin PilQ family protein [Blastocatellia bacterium]|nr:type IV pilus secretin PilQ family protein [Blastocatellia bacterium]
MQARCLFYRFIQVLLGVGFLMLDAAWAASPTNGGNAIQGITAQGLPRGKVVIKFTLKQKLANPPGTFSVNTPPRIALDFADTSNAIGKNFMELREGELRNLNIVQAGTRTRVVMSLNRSVPYETKIEGNTLLLTLQGAEQIAAGAETATRFAEPAPTASAHSIREVDFRRGQNAEGRVVIDLSDATTGIDIRRQGRNLVVEFVNASLAKNLERRLDVRDFGTPVKFVEARSFGANVRVSIEPEGQWEHSAYQTDRQFIVEVKRLIEDPNKLVQTTQTGYAGEKLSLNFQNVEIRSVLQVIADFTGLNIIASDSVQGNITLRLKDVPWDQALDIILQSKSLSKRKNGNVVLIAPTDEVNTKEKLALEANQQISELEQLQTESFQLSYQKAEDLRNLLSDEKQRILSKRGSSVFDGRTNTLFVQDTGSRLDELRKLIVKIDVPVRQVMIEARIVIADDKWSKQLGFRFGGRGGYNRNNTNLGVASTLDPSATIASGTNTAVNVSDIPNVSVPIAGASPTGSIAFTLLNIGSGNLIGFELQALEADKRGKIVSSPRVITADKQKAVIEQGTEIPYQTSSASGGTTISFKSAVLSLSVTPQITPDGRVIMDLEVKKDAVGQVFAGIPSIDTKKVLTQILVDDGETAVLGGIYEQTSRVDTEKVPVLGNIPFLGRLFKHDSRVDDKIELLIFITPKIIKDTLTAR